MSETVPGDAATAVAEALAAVWEPYWATLAMSVADLIEHRGVLDRQATELLDPVLQGLNRPGNENQLLSLAAGFLVSIANELILLAADPETFLAGRSPSERETFESIVVTSGVASWCERLGHPILALPDHSQATEIPLDDGMTILRTLDDEFGEEPPPAASITREEFAETLARSLSLYREALAQLPEPLTQAQRRQLDEQAVRCFIALRLIGGELTIELDDEPPNHDGGLIMHLALILAASMRLMASKASPTELANPGLLREETEQSEWVDHWIQSVSEPR